MTVRLRPDLDDLPVYVPGKTHPGAVKLASNEVTFGPLPSVAAAIADAAASVNRYPDNAMVELTAALAKKLDVTPEEIQVGCGSVTLCQNLVTITCRPGDEVLFGWRSFETYPLATRIAGATPVQVPLDDDLAYDLPAMAEAITDRTRLIFVCNPNNPTGTVVSRDDLVAFLRKVPDDVVVALDEAYFEYMRLGASSAYDALELRRDFPNLVVLRTFSKAYGLAGLRVGYAVADPAVITALGKVHIPFSINSLAQHAAVACLKADDELLARTEAVVTERVRVTAQLRTLGYRVPESQANFVWLDLGADSLPFARASADAGVIIRPFDGDGVRVTVTHPAENDVFLGFASDWARR
ncbi:histidinol-phosphate aminotransferase [Gordonia araii NBRC 100433]|uniref:Aromatic amino acid aminotransferase n=1 Tax=Gordonia araii NBRC 100433 TaxID=1073574 RepID=G7GXM1_9ACTN|nr:histidinol-phosphate transaminase [Gordonia araii]NNG98215.1 histidinol-phosphate transaminase [Gordonia araii NBRC 100433]GAB08346.1 histidinol-phosphate aminotransferase [Gordonia araii NBRC 100433]